jgi:hypothetical protein
MTCASTQAFASDGDSDGGEGGDSDGGDSGGDSSGSGSDGGEGNSGSGGDDGDDHDDSDNDGDDDSSGSSSAGGKSQDDARDAVREGKVIPLSAAITSLRDRYTGRIIDVRLTERGNRIDYRFKVVGPDGKVVSVTMNARNGRMRGFFGF